MLSSHCHLDCCTLSVSTEQPELNGTVPESNDREGLQTAGQDEKINIRQGKIEIERNRGLVLRAQCMSAERRSVSRHSPLRSFILLL